MNTTNKKKDDRNFYLVKQESSRHEVVNDDGILKDVHMVPKDKPFVLILASETLNLSKMAMFTTLVYDFEDEQVVKEVQLLRSSPIEHKAHFDSQGRKCTLELRIKVLSSQHEEMLFRVAVQIVDPTTKATFSLYSNPIRVVSKPKKAVGIQQWRNASKRKFNNEMQSPDNTTSTTIANNTSPHTHQVLINTPDTSPHLINHDEIKENSIQINTSTLNEKAQDMINTNPPSSVHVNEERTLSTIFQELIDCYGNIPQCERPLKLQRVVDEIHLKSSNDLCEQLIQSLVAAANPFAHIDSLDFSKNGLNADDCRRLSFGQTNSSVVNYDNICFDLIDNISPISTTELNM